MVRPVYTYFDTSSPARPTLARVEAYLTQLSNPPPNFTLAIMRVPDSFSDSEAIDRGRTTRLLYEDRKWLGVFPRFTPTLGQLSLCGVNLASPNYYQSAFPFKDLFRNSDSFRTSDGSFTPTLGPDGYASADIPVGKHLWALVGIEQWDGTLFHYPSGPGTYYLLWDGSGPRNGPGGAPVEVSVERDCTSFVVESPGRARITVVPSHDGTVGLGLMVRQYSTDASPNHVRNVRLLHSSHLNTYQADPWQPKFIENCLPYGLLRFMDFLKTNNSLQTNWADRAPIGYQTYAGDVEGVAVEKGVPIELICALGVKLQADIAVNVPHLATDTYVTEMATLVKSNYSDLYPAGKVHVSWSNEVWNPTFSQQQYAQQQGNILFAGQGSEFDRLLRFIGWRTYQVVRLWDTVYGASAGAKLVRCFDAQFANPYTGQFPLDSLADDGQPVYKKIDKVLVGPYFGHHVGRDPLASTSQNWSLAQLRTETLAEIAGASPYEGDPWYAQDMPSLMKQWVALAKARVNAAGKSLVLGAYEGGQHWLGVGGGWDTDPELNALFNAANRDPTVARDAYQSLLRLWDTGGTFSTGSKEPRCQHFAVFSDAYQFRTQNGRFGRWGLREYQDSPIGSPAAVKAAAIEDYLFRNPKVF